MSDNIRGIECSLFNGGIKDLLLFLSNKPYDFYVRWCMKIDNNRELLPKSSNNYRIFSSDLKKLAKSTIWELVLDIYPMGENSQMIETYDDFINSQCLCCLIFYDCALLDIYVKESTLRDQIYNLLCSLQAKDIEIITDSTDGRTLLST